MGDDKTQVNVENAEKVQTEAPDRISEEEVTSGDKLGDGAVEEGEGLPGDGDKE